MSIDIQKWKFHMLRGFSNARTGISSDKFNAMTITETQKVFITFGLVWDCEKFYFAAE